MQSLDLARVSKLLASSSGRDKTLKLLLYVLRLMISLHSEYRIGYNKLGQYRHISIHESKMMHKMQRAATNIGIARKFFLFLLSVDEVRSLVEVCKDANATQLQVIDQVLNTLNTVADDCAIASGTVFLFPKRWQSRADWWSSHLWAACLIIALYTTWRDIRLKQQQIGTDEKDQSKLQQELQELQYSLLKYTSDSVMCSMDIMPDVWVRVLPKRTQLYAGLLSAVLAWRKIWLKTR